MRPWISPEGSLIERVSIFFRRLRLPAPRFAGATRGSSLVPMLVLSTVVTGSMISSMHYFDSTTKIRAQNRTIASRGTVEHGILQMSDVGPALRKSAQMMASNAFGSQVGAWARSCLQTTSPPETSHPCYATVPPAGGGGYYVSSQTGHLQGFALYSAMPDASGNDVQLTGRWLLDAGQDVIENPVYYKPDGSRCSANESEVAENCPFVAGSRLVVSCGVSPICSPTSATYVLHHTLRQRPDLNSMGLGGSAAADAAYGQFADRARSVVIEACRFSSTGC